MIQPTSLARFGLAAFLAYTAAAKFDHLFLRGGLAGSASLPFLVAAAVEVVFVASLLVRPWSRIGAGVIAAAFLGATVETALVISKGGAVPGCHCLGRGPLPLEWALAMQVAVVALASSVFFGLGDKSGLRT